MLNKEDIEGFLDRLSAEGASYKELEPGLWVVKPGGALDFDVVVHYSPPVVLLRVKVMELPKDKKYELWFIAKNAKTRKTELIAAGKLVQDPATGLWRHSVPVPGGRTDFNIGALTIEPVDDPEPDKPAGSPVLVGSTA